MSQLLRDTQLMTLIMVLVLIDCIIVSSWAIFDPMHVNLRNLTLEIDPSDRTVVYQPQVRTHTMYIFRKFFPKKTIVKNQLKVVNVFLRREILFYFSLHIVDDDL